MNMDIVREASDDAPFAEAIYNLREIQRWHNFSGQLAIDSWALWQRSVIIRVVRHCTGGDSYLQQAQPTAAANCAICT